MILLRLLDVKLTDVVESVGFRDGRYTGFRGGGYAGIQVGECLGLLNYGSAVIFSLPIEIGLLVGTEVGDSDVRVGRLAGFREGFRWSWKPWITSSVGIKRLATVNLL